MRKLFTRFILFVAANMSAYCFPFVGRPFKGSFAYEIQTGPLVWMWKHEPAYYDHTVHISRRRVSCGRFALWYDTIWFFTATWPLRRFQRSLHIVGLKEA